MAAVETHVELFLSEAQRARIEARLLSMPPVRAMQLGVLGLSADGMRLGAPLAANVNDKGCAFGGSLSGLMTLSAWAHATAVLDRHGFEKVEVYVQDSQVRYLLPLYADLVARAWLDPAQDWDDFIRTFRERGKARARVLAEICCPDGRVAASFEGRFVALKPSSQD